MATSPTDSDTINLNRLARRACRGVLWVCVATAVASGAAYMLGRLQRPVYEAQVMLTLRHTPIFGSYTMSLVGVRMVEPDLRTLATLTREEQVIARTFADASLAPFAEEGEAFVYSLSLMGCTVTPRGTLLLAVQGRDPDLIRTLADTWAPLAAERVSAEFGVSEATIQTLRGHAAGALERWESLHAETSARPDGGFAGERLRADAEAARTLYVSLAQAVQQAQLSRDAAREAASVAGPARVLETPIRPQPRHYALVAALLTLTGGLCLVLIVELVRIDR